MRKKSYIFAVAAVAAALMLTGCGKKNNADSRTPADETVNGDEADEDGTDEDGTDGDGTDSDSASEGSSIAESIGEGREVPGDVLEFEASDFVKLGDYKGLEVTYPSVLAVTDEDVQEEIQYELEENTDYREVSDRAAKDGDSVNIDFSGTIDGEEFEGGSDEGYELELGAGEFLEDFEKNLVGKKTGETVVFKITFPEDYDDELGGKEAEFTVKINSISEAVVPEYNDEYVKSISDYETIADYEASVRKQLEADAEDDSLIEAQENALLLAVENAEVSGYPQKLYDYFYDDTVEGYKNYAELMGIDYEELLEEYVTEDEIVEMVVEEVREYLIVRAILQEEGQEISDSEYSKLVEELAKENDYDTAAEYEEDYGEIYVKTQVAREKAVDILYNAARLKELPYDEYYGEDSDSELEIEE